MAVALDDLFASQTALAAQRQSAAADSAAHLINVGAASFLNMLDRISLREYTEPSFQEAAAMSKAGESADAARVAALRTAVHVPEPSK